MDHYEYRLATEFDSRQHERQTSASLWAVVYFCMAAFGLLGVIAIWGKHSYRDPQSILMVISGTLFAVGGIGASVNVFRWRDADLLTPETIDDDPPPPRRDASDALTFEQRIAALEAELVARDNPRPESTEGNTIKLGKYKPDKGSWADLAETLRRHEWRWTRDIVADAQVFTNLTSRFSDITKDMVSIGFVEGEKRNWEISQQGKLWMIQQSPRLRLEDMR